MRDRKKKREREENLYQDNEGTVKEGRRKSWPEGKKLNRMRWETEAERYEEVITCDFQIPKYSLLSAIEEENNKIK